jgi:indole-3-glycerol phosphate synthase
VTGGRFGHAIADGEGISLIVRAEDGAANTLAVRGDPAAVVSVVDFVAGTAVPHAAEVELAVRVRDEEQLERALGELDPELLVLAGTLEAVLDLLPDVPAGKLAIAELPVLSEDDIEELERAGVDAVIVRERDHL